MEGWYGAHPRENVPHLRHRASVRRRLYPPSRAGFLNVGTQMSLFSLVLIGFEVLTSKHLNPLFYQRFCMIPQNRERNSHEGGKNSVYGLIYYVKDSVRLTRHSSLPHSSFLGEREENHGFRQHPAPSWPPSTQQQFEKKVKKERSKKGRQGRK